MPWEYLNYNLKYAEEIKLTSKRIYFASNIKQNSKRISKPSSLKSSENLFPSERIRKSILPEIIKTIGFLIISMGIEVYEIVQICLNLEANWKNNLKEKYTFSVLRQNWLRVQSCFGSVY